jgi:electron transfer flavoprotein beta subunit
VHVVILTKAVPNTTEAERLDDRSRIDRVSVDPIINPNDEHALEVALQLAETLPDVETTMLTMAPESSWPGLSKGLAAGIGRSVLISDDALEGSCTLSTANVLAAALRRLPFDLLLAGQDTSDGRGGVVAAAVATLLELPFIALANDVTVADGELRVKRLRDDGYEILAAPLPSVVTVTQAVGEMRYPSLRGVMAARSKRPEVWSLGDLGLADSRAGGAFATTRVVGADPAVPRPPTRVVTGDSATVVQEVMAFLAERRIIS